MLSECTVLVHRPFSKTVPQITKDETLHVSTVRETDSPPIYLNRYFMNTV